MHHFTAIFCPVSSFDQNTEIESVLPLEEVSAQLCLVYLLSYSFEFCAMFE